MFYCDSRHIYRSTELDALPWLIHGFGTRRSDIPAVFENLATVKQMHSGSCISADGRSGVLGQGGLRQRQQTRRAFAEGCQRHEARCRWKPESFSKRASYIQSGAGKPVWRERRGRGKTTGAESGAEKGSRQRVV